MLLSSTQRVDDGSPWRLPSHPTHPRALAKTAAARDVLGRVLVGEIPLRKGLISALNELLGALGAGRENEEAAA